ncbi:MAG: M20 family peptidase [Calditrichaeota bacterium]|nr:MAG: M20 family peptidase [Calditrichota bacterium]
MKNKQNTVPDLSEVLSLSKKLVQINTINPPGDEKKCAHFIGEILYEQGYQVQYYEFEKNRTSLIARLPGVEPGKPLCFSGHIDTVPLGQKKWKADPFSGEIIGDKLYGRGSSDMKAAVAAMVAVACHHSRRGPRKSELALIITAGEEKGCAGAEYLAGLPNILPQGGVLIIGEPTSNYPFIGHKGCLWLNVEFSGTTAHGSMPELGDNAIYKASDAIQKLRGFKFQNEHPVLGRPSLNIGTMQGGLNINSVPDKANFTIDIRTVKGQTHQDIIDAVQKIVGKEAQISTLINTPSVSADANNSWIQQVFQILEKRWQKQITPKAAPYFTDAGALVPAMGFPETLILGPGELEQAHATDEFCYVSRIQEAVEIYSEIADRWLY